MGASTAWTVLELELPPWSLVFTCRITPVKTRSLVCVCGAKEVTPDRQSCTVGTAQSQDGGVSKATEQVLTPALQERTVRSNNVSTVLQKNQMVRPDMVHGLLALTFWDLWLFLSHFRHKTGINILASKVLPLHRVTRSWQRLTCLSKQKEVGHLENLSGLLCH